MIEIKNCNEMAWVMCRVHNPGPFFYKKFIVNTVHAKIDAVYAVF